MAKRRGFKRLTLIQQWLIATLLAILPLLLAVGYAVWSLAEQSQQHRRLLLSMSALKDLDAAVERQISGLQRANLQYAHTGDPLSRELYYERLKSLREYQQELVITLPQGGELTTLNQLIQTVAGFDVYLTTAQSELSLDEISQAWQTANRLRVEFSNQIDELTQDSIRNSDARFEQVVQRLVFIGALTIPITTLLLILSTTTVTRPLRRLSNAIQRLGRYRWDEPVYIDGPTDFTKLGKSLEWMRDQLQTSDRQKQAFLRHITHELKSPLAAIVEAESLLRDEVPGHLNDSQRQVLGILRTNAQNLSELIQQLLNYNAVKHSLIPEITEVNVREKCAQIWQRLVNTPERGKIRSQWEGTDDIVMTDPLCLDMILSNLLSNCRNLADQVKVSWGQQDNRWWLTVEDNGPGISPAEAENIFKPFYQGSAQRRGSLKGSGIGLSIVRECVERLHGTITVDRGSLGGARFTLTFPIKHWNLAPAALKEQAI